MALVFEGTRFDPKYFRKADGTEGAQVITDVKPPIPVAPESKGATKNHIPWVIGGIVVIGFLYWKFGMKKKS